MAKGSGWTAAPDLSALSLLPSGPDEVRYRPVHRTRTLRQTLASLMLRAASAEVKAAAGERAEGEALSTADRW
jgi:hypothetical protein